MIDQHLISQVVHTLESRNTILVITGAGISAESGIPTYRGIGGLYEDMVTEDGLSVEDVLSGRMLDKRPDITWQHIYEIEEKCRGVSYNSAHKVLAEMENVFERIVIFTQNIDGFHQKAGSKNVIDIHGTMNNLRCTNCYYTEHVDNYAHLSVPPLCPDCQAIIRPDIVLFGEMLPLPKLEKFRAECQKGFDIIFSIGTTSMFPYIAQPIIDAKNAGIPIVEINPSETDVSRFVDYKIKTKAGGALEAIWESVKSRR